MGNLSILQAFVELLSFDWSRCLMELHQMLEKPKHFSGIWNMHVRIYQMLGNPSDFQACEAMQ